MALADHDSRQSREPEPQELEKEGEGAGRERKTQARIARLFQRARSCAASRHVADFTPPLSSSSFSFSLSLSLSVFRPTFRPSTHCRVSRIARDPGRISADFFPLDAPLSRQSRCATAAARVRFPRGRFSPRQQSARSGQGALSDRRSSPFFSSCLQRVQTDPTPMRPGPNMRHAFST